MMRNYKAEIYLGRKTQPMQTLLVAAKCANCQVLQSKFTPGCDEDSLSDEAEDANAEDTDDHSSSQSSEDLMAVEDNL